MPHVAVMTFSILKAPYGDVSVREFDDRTPDVFVEAESGPGFVARARPVVDTAWMTNFQKDWGAWGPFAVPRFYLGGTTSGHTRQAQTLSVWSDLRAVWQFAYRGPLHRVALQDRKEWFGPQDWPIYCLWWTDWPAPLTWPEACRRLEHLHDHGPTPESFTFHRLFDAEGRPTRLAPAAVPVPA